MTTWVGWNHDDGYKIDKTEESLYEMWGHQNKFCNVYLDLDINLSVVFSLPISDIIIPIFILSKSENNLA